MSLMHNTSNQQLHLARSSNYQIEHPQSLFVDERPEDFYLPPKTDVEMLRRHTSIAGSPVEYTIFEPYELSTDTPVHIRNGFFGAGPAYSGLARVMASQGRRTIVTEAVRHRWHSAMLHPEILRLHAQAGYRVISEVNDEFGTDQADIIGHSMGSPTALMTARKHPHLVRSISSTGGAGLDGNNHFRHRLFHTPGVLLNEILPNLGAMKQDYDPGRSVLLDTVEYCSDLIGTAREAWDVARVDDRNKLVPLRETYGIKIALVLFGKDGYFHHDNVLYEAGDAVDRRYLVPDAIHIEPAVNPHRHAALQLQVFDELNHTPDLRAVV